MSFNSALHTMMDFGKHQLSRHMQIGDAKHLIKLNKAEDLTRAEKDCVRELWGGVCDY